MLLSDLLLEKAKDWWYYKHLRDQGHIQEAMAKERRSILSTLRNLKDAKANGGFCTVGRGGWTLYPRPGVTVSNCGGMESEYPQACLLMGIPLINSLTIPDSKIFKILSFPIPSLRPNCPPWGSMSFAPIEVVAALYKSLGATIYNIHPAYNCAWANVKKSVLDVLEKNDV